VTGLERSRGTTASDTAPLGSELAGVTGTGTNWALAGGATNLNVGGYVHTVGSVVPLTTSLAAVNGTYYQITYTITGRTAGSISITYGGTITGVSATGTYGPKASSTAVLTITPTTDFDGTIVLSIKSIGTSSASSTFSTSSGVASIEVRASDINTNTFIGTTAGSRNTIGYQNTYIGSQAGNTNTTGANNTFLGYQSGNSNTVAFNNTFIGHTAGYNNTTGGSNTFIGQSAGLSNTTGNNSTFVGGGAGFRNVSGVNTAMGYFSLYNTTGTDNVAVGNIVMQNNTTGATNTAFGVAALYNNVSGNKNIALGAFAGNNAGSGSTANQTSNNSLYIGYDVRSSANGNTNEVVIAGYNNSAGQVGLGSNTTVLGNSSTLTTAIYGNLLLGTTTDSGYKLDVTGTARVSGAATFSSSITTGGTILIPSDSSGNGGVILNYASNASGRSWKIANDWVAFGDFAISQSTTQTGGTRDAKLYISAAGNVGIGTSSPGGLLQINNTSTKYIIYTSSGNLELYQPESTASGTQVRLGSAYNLPGVYSNGQLNLNSDSSSAIAFHTNGNSERMRITSGGFLLVGNTNHTDGSMFENGGTNTALNAYRQSSTGGNGIIGFYSNVTSTKNIVAYFKCDGGLANYSGNNVNLSDERTKNSISPLDSYWDKFKAINIVKFKYNGQSHDNYNIGVIAQQVEKVAPEFVSNDGWGINNEDKNDLKAIYESDLHHATIKVLQEAMIKIEELSAEITILKNK
jgi:hypothetical protein